MQSLPYMTQIHGDFKICLWSNAEIRMQAVTKATLTSVVWGSFILLTVWCSNKGSSPDSPCCSSSWRTAPTPPHTDTLQLLSVQIVPVPVWPQQHTETTERSRARCKVRCLQLLTLLQQTHQCRKCRTQVTNDQNKSGGREMEVDQRWLLCRQIWLSKYQSFMSVYGALTNLQRRRLQKRMWRRAVQTVKKSRLVWKPYSNSSPHQIYRWLENQISLLLFLF